MQDPCGACACPIITEAPQAVLPSTMYSPRWPPPVGGEPSRRSAAGKPIGQGPAPSIVAGDNPTPHSGGKPPHSTEVLDFIVSGAAGPRTREEGWAAKWRIKKGPVVADRASRSTGRPVGCFLQAALLGVRGLRGLRGAPGRAIRGAVRSTVVGTVAVAVGVAIAVGIAIAAAVTMAGAASAGGEVEITEHVAEAEHVTQAAAVTRAVAVAGAIAVAGATPARSAPLGARGHRDCERADQGGRCQNFQ